MPRTPCHQWWRVARLAASLSRKSLKPPSTPSAGKLPASPQHHLVRPFTQFNVAAVRLLQLTLLDKPILDQRRTDTSKAAANNALTASSTQPSGETARFIPPAVLHDMEAWERWLDGIDGVQTFIVSRTLLPQLFERLTHDGGQQLSSNTQPIADDSAFAPQQLSRTAVDSAKQANPAPATVPERRTMRLELLQQRLRAVQSVPLNELVAPQRLRTKQQRGSTAIPPAPLLQSPLTQQQKDVFEAIPSGQLSAIAALYSPATPVMPVDQPHPSHGGTMLHIAAMHNRADVVHWLLDEHAANPNSRAFNHSTPLHWAAGNNAIASLHALLTRGSDPTLVSMTHYSTTVGKGSGQTPLHWAAESGHVDSVRLLSEWAPQLVAVEDERGRAPKQLAEAEGRIEVVRLVQQLEDEEYVGVRVELAYRGHRMMPAQQRKEGTTLRNT